MEETTGIATLDVLAPGFRVNSPEVREAARQHWYAHTALGPAILRYDDCVALLYDPGLRQAAAKHLSAQGVTEGPVAEMWLSLVLNIDGPDHARLRRLVSPTFAPAKVDRLRGRMREIAHSLIDEFADTGRCEFMADFADRYAPRVMFDLLGIPLGEHERFLGWGKDLALILSYDVPRHHDRLAAAIAGIGEVTDRLCEARRHQPGADLLSALVAACDGGDRLTQAEIRSMVVILILGGQDSTRGQMGLAMGTFSAHPKQWALLAERSDLAASAVEEVMRFNPVLRIGPWRHAHVDVDYRDLHIPAGTRILPMAGLAQLESDTPGEDTPFDITAERRPHLSFGHGTHYCLGAQLSRVEMAEALPILARRLPDLQLDGEGEYRSELAGFVGPESLPIRFTPTASTGDDKATATTGTGDGAAPHEPGR